PAQVRHYWSVLNKAIQRDLPRKRDDFGSLTRRPFQVRQADAALNPDQRDGQDYNGVMFSSKWLADDLGLTSDAELTTLRQLVDQAHQQTGFGDSSPADWWVLIMGDGDGMGQYVSGVKLHNYSEYVIRDAIAESRFSPGMLDALLNSRKRMGPATHVGLNRALLDFSNRLVPYLTEQRFCGRVVYSGGDDVMVMLPLADLPGYLRSLRAAWSGATDPGGEFRADGGYWHPPAAELEGIPKRPLFTMGKDATMSLGIVIAHKSVPLPTVLEKLWEAEKDRAKKMKGGPKGQNPPAKDGLCFRVIYGSGNTLEALMKGHLLESWWQMLESYRAAPNPKDALAPVLYRLAEELPRHADVTANHQLCSLVAKVVISNRDQQLPQTTQEALEQWLNAWEAWAWAAQPQQQELITKQRKSSEAAEKAAKTQTLGASVEDLGYLLRFTAFWASRRQQEQSWTDPSQPAGGTR
ncbi:MAG: Cas10/Cmr2 second palm domain-containing protein, partial [Elainella sp.]